MTTTETTLDSAPATPDATAETSSQAQGGDTGGAADWDAAFADLRERFPKAKDSILFAVHALQQKPDIALDDLKAQAALHEIRVTAASVTAARRLLDPEATPAKPTGRERKRRSAAPARGVEDLIRATVEQVQAQGEKDAERLRAAIRKAIAALEAAL